MAITTPLTQRLSLDAPIVLAPMAGVSGGRLATAVSDAGGLGLIGGGYCYRDWILREMALADMSRVGIGFITWRLADQPKLLDEVLEQRPRAVFLSFGDIGPFARTIKSQGVPLLVQVQTVQGALEAVRAGADFIVAQGSEAGGHGGSRATLPLVPEVKDAVGEVPVLAAGGITDGRGLAACMMLGATGAVCGTAFYAATEALAHPHSKSAAADATGDQTDKTSVFDIARGFDWPKAWQLRALSNGFSEKWAGNLATLKADELERRRYAEAADRGDMSVAGTIVGEGVGLVRGIEPAASILELMARAAEDQLRSASSLLGEPDQ
ncbi:MAG: nitronate monooxygenase [Pseudomonadota bacterium]